MIVGILRKAGGGQPQGRGVPPALISSARSYAWKAKVDAVAVSDARRLKALEDASARPKPLLADAMLDNTGPKDLPSRK